MKLFLKQISLLFRNFLYHYNPHWSHEATILLNSLITDACPFLRGFVRSTRIIVSINVNIRRRLDTKSWWHFGKYPKKILHILLDIFYISNLISNIIHIYIYLFDKILRFCINLYQYYQNNVCSRLSYYNGDSLFTFGDERFLKIISGIRNHTNIIWKNTPTKTILLCKFYEKYT